MTFSVVWEVSAHARQNKEKKKSPFFFLFIERQQQQQGRSINSSIN